MSDAIDKDSKRSVSQRTAEASGLSESTTQDSATADKVNTPKTIETPRRNDKVGKYLMKVYYNPYGRRRDQNTQPRHYENTVS